jgi:hypothetical protein
MQFEGVTECPNGYTLDDDYVHEHRDAEHEHELEPMGGYEAAQRPLFCLSSEYEIAR